jgi:rRNA maturation endonuclease Nob1
MIEIYECECRRMWAREFKTPTPTDTCPSCGKKAERWDKYGNKFDKQKRG